MTPTNESVLTEELIERVKKLDPLNKGRLLDILLHGEPEDDPETVAKAWKEEIARRAESVLSGTAILYTAEETEAHLRQLLAEGRAK